MRQQYEGGFTQSAVKEPETARGHRDRQLLMMVDDDANDRTIYGDVLCYNGYDVVMAASVREALERVESHDPDLILLDMGLPDGSGLDVCAGIGGRSEREMIPIIALSAFRSGEMEARAITAGCSIYVEKPASPVNVLHHIERLIGRAPLPGDGRPPAVVPSAEL